MVERGGFKDKGDNYAITMVDNGDLNGSLDANTKLFW